MRFRRLFLVLIPIVLLVGVVGLFVIRARGAAAFGPAVALCPGPDHYGYRCQSGAGFAYIDATTDTFLYSDDGTVTLDLPFPFTFYGTIYSQVTASSNGNLQFTTQNPAYVNSCLDDGPVAGMGDLIAPYWDDLDLTFFGYLEYDVVGQAPNRIFVVEWDNIPRFGHPEDRVTFAVQLIEGSNDIVFLYQDVTTVNGYNGSSATIGLQSEAQGLALQYGCNQPVVADASAIHFVHPANPNREVGLGSGIGPTSYEDSASFSVEAKGEVATLIEALNQHGRAALPQLRRDWLNQSPMQASQWQWADLTGDGREELVFLWRGQSAYPSLTRLAVLGMAKGEQAQLLFNDTIATRAEPFQQLELYTMADVTHDGRADVVLRDAPTGRLFVVTGAAGRLEAHPVPERCFGSLGLLDVTGNGRLEIVRDRCQGDSQGRVARTVYTWNGAGFVPSNR